MYTVILKTALTVDSVTVAVILSSKHTTHSRGPESVGLRVFVVFFFFFVRSFTFGYIYLVGWNNCVVGRKEVLLVLRNLGMYKGRFVNMNA